MQHFVALERQFLGSNPLFISEIDADVIAYFTGKSRFFRDTKQALFVAANGRQDSARCVALINPRYQQSKHEKVGFIGRIAALPDSQTDAQTLFEHAETWLKTHGATRVIAPYNGSPFLGMGCLTTAFQDEPVFPFYWHPPYYSEYLIHSGYTPTYPLLHYTVDFSSEKYRTVKHRASQNGAVKVRPISKKHWNQDLDIFGKLLNETLKDEWEFHPYSRQEFHEFFDPMKQVLDTRQMLIGEVEGQPAGWCLGLPDWNPLFRSFKGRIGVLQIIKLMLRAGQYNRAGLIGIGVLPNYQGTGLAQALAIALYERYEELGLKQAFYHFVNKDNARSRRFAESMGGTGRILYHCYDKQLN